MNFLLDTNVISEAHRKSPEAISWLSQADPESLFLSVLTLGEIERGATKLRKRDVEAGESLRLWLNAIMSDFADRILPVTARIAVEWGMLSAGRTIGVVDTILAATARIHGLAIVTRNVADFADTGLVIVNPWNPGDLAKKN